jgi:drug/metabolite transporter (DMT)-like permease
LQPDRIHQAFLDEREADERLADHVEHADDDGAANEQRGRRQDAESEVTENPHSALQYGIVGAEVPGADDAPSIHKRPLFGAALLFATSIVWGFAFVPQKLTVTALPPFTATAVRFAFAAPLALLAANRRLLKPGVRVQTALGLGVLLFVIYVLQTAALVYAPVARVSLITGMYAVFVPLFAPLLGHARPTFAHWAGAALAFAGLLGLTGVFGGVDALTSVPLNIGDVLVFGHALLSAFQVLLIGRLAAKADPFALNALQLCSVLALAAPVALFVEGVPALSSLSAGTWASFGYLAMFSTVIAFTLQIAGQRHTSPPTAAVIMLLETPVGVVGALWFLDERMSAWQWLGAVVLLAGVVVSLVAELKRSRAA